MFDFERSLSETRCMDMIGPMPDEAWFEIRDANGKLLEAVAARIAGGGISAELPVFPPGTRGKIELCMRWAGDEKVVREEEELRDLPTEPVLQLVQIG